MKTDVLVNLIFEVSFYIFLPAQITTCQSFTISFTKPIDEAIEQFIDRSDCF